MNNDIKTVKVRLVNDTVYECPECKDTGKYQVENVYSGPYEVPCEFCDEGVKVLTQLFPEEAEKLEN